MDHFKSHCKHTVLFCRGWQINATALYQANNYKWIAWYPIKKSHPYCCSRSADFTPQKHRRHQEAEHERSPWSRARQNAVSRTGGNFPEIRNISGKWKKKSSTWAAPWRHRGTITSKMSAFRRTPTPHQAIWIDRRQGKTICTFITGWLRTGIKRPKSERGMESEELHSSTITAHYECVCLCLYRLKCSGGRSTHIKVSIPQ